MASTSPAPIPGGAETASPPDWYSHGLNRVGYYRLAAGVAGRLPRAARLRLARGLGRLFARAVPAERRAVRSNLSRVLAGAPPLVSFFGEPAAFPLGPFVLARAAGAAVVHAFCVMAAGDRYRLEIEPPIWVKPGEEQAALAATVAALERVIRAYPTQWFNFFDAWSPPHGPA